MRHNYDVAVTMDQRETTGIIGRSYGLRGGIVIFMMWQQQSRSSFTQQLHAAAPWSRRSMEHVGRACGNVAVYVLVAHAVSRPRQ